VLDAAYLLVGDGAHQRSGRWVDQPEVVGEQHGHFDVAEHVLPG
jgi:hypothetical protein